MSRPTSHSMNVGNPGGPYTTFTPWREQVGKLCHSVIDRGGYPIAIACERPDQKANARLISAAPELFAACEKALEWAKANKQRAGTLDVDALADAIKKARQ